MHKIEYLRVKCTAHYAHHQFNCVWWFHLKKGETSCPKCATAPAATAMVAAGTAAKAWVVATSHGLDEFDPNRLPIEDRQEDAVPTM